PGGRLIALDRDADAIEAGSANLAALRDHLSIIIVQGAFDKLDFILDQLPAVSGVRFDGVLLDLGVSSHQLDAARGFSFRRDEPLDMRMDTGSGPTAADLLATATETEIARVLWEFGDERFARRIAHAIVERRSRKQPVRT